MLFLVIGTMMIVVAIVALVISYYCYKRLFYSPNRKPLGDDEYEIPDGEVYQAFRKDMIEWIKVKRALLQEDIEIKSFDGLTLRGKYFECKKGEPVELLFHGYRGSAERDVSGGIERCFALERNVILIDHRASGASDGNIITFGIKERYDCLKWIDYTIERFGKDVKIILSGVSMGAATVVMAAAEKLPENVVCALADCGYSSAKEIICKVMRDMKLPDKLVYPFARLGASIFAKFDLEETSPLQAVEKANIPIIFLHGTDDDFVPCEMSERLYERCTNKKAFVPIKGAAHGLAFPVDKDGYIKAVKEFEKEWKK